MKQVICPLDSRPCERDCPDRYIDKPDGGCFLTTARELGFQILYLGGGNVGARYVPSGRKGMPSDAVRSTGRS